MSKILTRDQVLARIRDRAHPTQAVWADLHEISPQYVSDVLNGRRPPGPSILRALGLKKVEGYQEA